MAKKKMNGFVFALRAIFGFLIGLIGWLAIFYFITRPDAADGPTVGLMGLGIFVVSFFVNAPHCRWGLDSFKSFLAFVLIYIPLFPIIGFIFMLRGAADFRKSKKKKRNGDKESSKGVFVARAVVGFVICLIGWVCILVNITTPSDAIGNRTTLPLVALAAFIVGNIVSPYSCRVKIRSFKGLLYAVFIYALLFPIIGFGYLIWGIRNPYDEADDDDNEEYEEKRKPDSTKPTKDGGWNILVREIKNCSVESVQHYPQSAYIGGEVRYVNPTITGGRTSTKVFIKVTVTIYDKGGYVPSEVTNRAIKEARESYLDEVSDSVECVVNRWMRRIDELRDENYVDMFGEWEFNWEIVPMH